MSAVQRKTVFFVADRWSYRLNIGEIHNAESEAIFLGGAIALDPYPIKQEKTYGRAQIVKLNNNRDVSELSLTANGFLLTICLPEDQWQKVFIEIKEMYQIVSSILEIGFEIEEVERKKHTISAFEFLFSVNPEGGRA